MHCPKCGSADTKVLDSRPLDTENAIRRKRECNACGQRFKTIERVEYTQIQVLKKDGTRELFSREKLIKGLLRACDKTPVSLGDLEELVADIEATLASNMEYEVESTQIGEMVMERLRKLNDIAYVRFASVYRQFKDISTFMAELNKLLENP